MSIHSITDRARVPPDQMSGRARFYLGIAATRHILVALCTWFLADRFTAPSFDQILAILPLWCWGVAFAGAGLACGAAAIIGHETLARVGLILSAGSTALWAGGFLAALMAGPANVGIVGVIIWWALAAKDLVVCRQPIRSPFESLARLLATEGVPPARSGD